MVCAENRKSDEESIFCEHLIYMPSSFDLDGARDTGSAVRFRLYKRAAPPAHDLTDRHHLRSSHPKKKYPLSTRNVFRSHLQYLQYVLVPVCLVASCYRLTVVG